MAVECSGLADNSRCWLNMGGSTSRNSCSAISLQRLIRQLETLEADYVKTINDQIREGKERDRLLAFYRKVVADNGITVDENSRKYKGKYDDYWTVPA